MIFQTIVPILYSRDIPASVAYYTGILGFTGKWMYGDPPSFAGINKDSVEVFFSNDHREFAGTSIAIMVDNVDEYYESVKAKGANVKMHLRDMPSGMREFLVEDPDGHIIRFGHRVSSAHKAKSTYAESGSFRIVEKIPPQTNPLNIVYGVVAEDPATGEPIGGAHLLSDNTGFFYLKDVHVHPDWQGRGIGTKLMQTLSAWLDKNAPANSSIWLHTGEHLTHFYKEFGFIPVQGMARFINPPGTPG
jgi:catechol 2,3-dioxygenase-like lactoylglutathione lyase family enzyme